MNQKWFAFVMSADGYDRKFANMVLWILFDLRMPAPVLFLSSEFSNLWICYTLWDKTNGNIKRNSLFGRYFVLDTNL